MPVFGQAPALGVSVRGYVAHRILTRSTGQNQVFAVNEVVISRTCESKWPANNRPQSGVHLMRIFEPAHWAGNIYTGIAVSGVGTPES